MNQFLGKLKKNSDQMVVRLNRPEDDEKSVQPPMQMVSARRDFGEIVNDRLKRHNISVPALVIFCGIGCGIICGTAVFWWTHRDVPLSYIPSAASSVPTDTSVEEIVARVGKIFLLPEGEIPTMAVISDIERLKEQLFFKNAKNGQIVLMYAKAQRAILYDSATNRVIEVAPIVQEP